MTAPLVLIASYPKSGNTWTRLVLENLLRGGQGVSINDLSQHLYGSQRRRIFDGLAPAAAADLLPDEIENLFPKVLRHLAAGSAGPIFIKTHDFARRTGAGCWLFPPDCVKAVLHVVRHPFDVAVSFAHHLGVTTDATIRLLGEERAVIAASGKGLDLPLREVTGTWSTHKDSWLGHTPYPVVCARYEDLCADPLSGFSRLALGAGLNVSRGDVVRAVEAARFEGLQLQERVAGFRESPRASSTFFRAGKPGTGKRELSAHQMQVLTADHRMAMQKLGYLNSGETLVGHTSG